MVEKLERLKRESNGVLPTVTGIGGYPLFYLAADNGVICPDCANSNDCQNADKDDEQWWLVEYAIHEEGPPLICTNCDAEIESSCGDPNETEGEKNNQYDE